jgi:hypothetical protein
MLPPSLFAYDDTGCAGMQEEFLTSVAHINRCSSPGSEDLASAAVRPPRGGPSPRRDGAVRLKACRVLNAVTGTTSLASTDPPPASLISGGPPPPTRSPMVKTDAQLRQDRRPALGAKRRGLAAIHPGARAIPSPKNVARQRPLWSIRRPGS